MPSIQPIPGEIFNNEKSDKSLMIIDSRNAAEMQFNANYVSQKNRSGVGLL